MDEDETSRSDRGDYELASLDHAATGWLGYRSRDHMSSPCTPAADALARRAASTTRPTTSCGPGR